MGRNPGKSKWANLSESQSGSHPLGPRGNILHTRNQDLGNHRGFLVALSNGLSVACSTGSSRFSGIFTGLSLSQGIVTKIVQWIVSGIFQWMVTLVRSGV